MINSLKYKTNSNFYSHSRVGEQAHRQEEVSLLPIGSSLAAAAAAASVNVPRGEEVSANDAIN